MILLISLALITAFVAICLFFYGLFILLGNAKSQKQAPLLSEEVLSLLINGENIPIEEGVLLNTLWAHLPDADCKEGECGGCRIKLLKGNVEWVRKPIYKLENQSYILPCSCKAKTSLVCELVN